MAPKVSDIPGRGAFALLRNAGYFLGGRGLNSALRFGYVILLTRFLGPELYGRLAYGMSWYLAFLPLTGMGLDVILSHRVGSDREKGADTVSQTFTLRVLVSAATALACGIAGWAMESPSELRWLLIIFAAALFGRALSLWVDSVLVAYERMKHTLRLSVAFRPMEVAAGICVLSAGGGIYGLALVQAVSWWAQAIRGLFLLRSLGIPTRWSWQCSLLFPLLLRGLPIMASDFLFTGMVQGPLVLFRRFSGNAEGLGQLALAIQVIGVLSQAPQALNTAALPILSRCALRGDGRDADYLSLMVRMAVVAGTGLGILGLGVSPWLVAHIIGEPFVPAARMMALSLWLMIPWTCGTVAARILYAKGRYLPQLFSAGAGALVLLGSFSPFVHRFGPAGALAAAGGGMSLWAACLLGVIRRGGGIKLGTVLIKPLLAAGGASILYFGAAGFGVWGALPLSLVALFVLTVRMGIVTPEERAGASQAVHCFFKGRS